MTMTSAVISNNTFTRYIAIDFIAIINLEVGYLWIDHCRFFDITSHFGLNCRNAQRQVEFQFIEFHNFHIPGYGFLVYFIRAGVMESQCLVYNDCNFRNATIKNPSSMTFFYTRCQFVVPDPNDKAIEMNGNLSLVDCSFDVVGQAIFNQPSNEISLRVCGTNFTNCIAVFKGGCTNFSCANCVFSNIKSVAIEVDLTNMRVSLISCFFEVANDADAIFLSKQQLLQLEVEGCSFVGAKKQMIAAFAYGAAPKIDGSCCFSLPYRDVTVFDGGESSGLLVADLEVDERGDFGSRLSLGESWFVRRPECSILHRLRYQQLMQDQI
jgi:hypothetical protein